MYAIIEVAGKQFKALEGKWFFLPKLPETVGHILTLNRVLLLAYRGETEEVEENVLVGAPFLEGVSIEVEVLAHCKGDKVTVLKKKRRKGYKVKQGHRQSYTKVLVKNIKGINEKVEGDGT